MKKSLYIAVEEIAATLSVGRHEEIVVSDDGIYNAIINVYEDGSFAYTAEPAIVEAQRGGEDDEQSTNPCRS